MNALTAIYPYKYEGLWVFDDPKVGLVQEPFVSGADVIIDRMTSQIPNAERGFPSSVFGYSVSGIHGAA
jgi:hypothetical protein